MSLDELERLAKGMQNDPDIYAVEPEQILALVAIVRAADAMRDNTAFRGEHEYVNAYNAARAALDKTLCRYRRQQK